MPRVIAILLAVGVLLAPVGADWPAAPSPRTAQAAAEAARVASAEGKHAALAALAAQDEPDPWWVADELLRLGAPDVAEAFARAATRADVVALPDYVAARRSVPDDAAGREALAAATTALGERRWAAVVAALGEATGAPGIDVVAIRRQIVLAHAFRGMGRLGDAAMVGLAAVQGAQGLRWQAGAWAAIEAIGPNMGVGRADAALLEHCERRLRSAEVRGAPREVARALDVLGRVQDRAFDRGEALRTFQRSQGIKEREGDRAGLLQTLNDLAGVLIRLNRTADGLAHFERAVALAESLGDAPTAAWNLGPLGRQHAEDGNYAAALDFSERALPAKERAGDRWGVAWSLRGLGILHWRLGSLAKAKAYHEQAHRVFVTIGDRAGIAAQLGNLAIIEEGLGNLARAVELHEQTCTLDEALGDRGGLAITQHNLAGLHLRLGDVERAGALQRRALALFRELGLPRYVAQALSGLANCVTEPSERLSLLDESLRISEAEGDARTALGTRSDLLCQRLLLGVDEQALGDLARVAEQYETRGERGSHVDTLMRLSRGLLQAGRGEEAARTLDRALREAERGRLDPQVAQALGDKTRQALLAGHPDLATLHAKRAVGLLERQLGGLSDEMAVQARSSSAWIYALGALAASRSGDVREAAYFLEAGRAGAFLEALDARRMLRWVALPEQLKAAEDQARGREAAARAEHQRALVSGDVAAVRAATVALDRAEDDVADALARLQREAKRAAGLLYPRAATLEELQELLADDEVLLLYGLAADEALALVVPGQGEARVVMLGPTADLLSALESLRLDKPVGEASAISSALRARLIAPLGLSSSVRRVFVAPEGPLTYVPFAPLLPSHDVVYAPSGTTLTTLLEDRAGPGARVLALGDPAYDERADERALRIHARDRRRRLARLPGTRAEAQALGDVVLLGEGASEAGLVAALAAESGRWRAVHLACHGLVDPERPVRSALALTPDASYDGFLTVLEVFRLQIPADLVVLSACDTGRGKVASGEGLIGFTRAFMFAGTPRVLCSLWKVDDEATAALMTKFYELWNPKDGSKGLGAADSLQQAQAYVRSQKNWEHPYYWAAWVLWGLP